MTRDLSCKEMARAKRGVKYIIDAAEGNTPRRGTFPYYQ